MPLPPDFIERLKAANPIDEVMGSYVTLKRSGRDYVCLCPFHNEKTPSCYVHPDRDFFHCFGCGAGGDVITFTMKYNNLDYMEAVKLLAERGGVPMPQDSFFGEKKGSGEFKKRLYEMNRTAAKFFYSKLKTPEGRQCLDYLVNKRRLSFETIKKYGMGFAPNSWSELKSYMIARCLRDPYCDLEKEVESYNCRLNSLTFGEQSNTGLVNQISVNINITGDYTDIMRYCRDVVTGEKIRRIDTINMSPYASSDTKEADIVIVEFSR